ncbi:hypothetical protein BD410DRAFT_522041 [Rickenella mellea]|uniref:F-box domain-containing protein n=1 Tax=Rickenella mellea TaxID=50990 RepID=A0A4Y7QFR9_9AGAM|nr:hypothetical protein BD410DRAFT_522041 [Rickenella mellea]
MPDVLDVTLTLVNGRKYSLPFPKVLRTFDTLVLGVRPCAVTSAAVSGQAIWTLRLMSRFQAPKDYLMKGCYVHFDQVEIPSLRELIVGEGSTMSLEDCSACLRHCPNLERFSVNYYDDEHRFTQSSDIIEAKALRDFHLTLNPSQPGSDHLLDIIHAPSLETLGLKFPYIDADCIGLPRLPRFSERSGARIVNMYIMAPMKSDQIIECLHHTPVLTDLWLRYTPFE